MPLIPEKLASRNDVKSSIACQFWEQPSHSTRSIDGQVWSLPCEPPALNLTGSSGLSRTQQLIAAQALGVPAFPSYDASSQGLVRCRPLLLSAACRRQHLRFSELEAACLQCSWVGRASAGAGALAGQKTHVPPS